MISRGNDFRLKFNLSNLFEGAFSRGSTVANKTLETRYHFLLTLVYDQNFYGRSRGGGWGGG